jgi:23S rRNA pseudouridine1911/1915/1917 synthase
MKPAGIPSGPTRDAARIHAATLAEEVTGRSLTLLHRLDKDTSGVLLFAKTRVFAAALLKAFRDREVGKTYLALVPGRPQGTFEVSCHLREGEGGRMLVVRSGGMKAETTFRTLAAKAGYALVEARPKTGRTHQIRVHLAQADHPILGDSTYGGAAEVGDEPVLRHMLHAWALEFQHPNLGTRVRVEAPPPEDFRQLAEALLGKCLPSGGRASGESVRRKRAEAGSEAGVHSKRARE